MSSATLTTTTTAAASPSRTPSLEGHVRTKLAGLTVDTLPSVSEARTAVRAWRLARGLSATVPSLLTSPDAQPKVGKNAVPTWVLHLAPAALSGFNACPWSTPQCRAGCLNTSGRGAMSGTQAARVRRTQLFADLPAAFLALVLHEVRREVARHGDIGLRLNGTSDIRWERLLPSLFTIGGVTFYDYTKAPASRSARVPATYHLTGSATERDTIADVAAKAAAFGRVAVVVDTPGPLGGAVKLPVPATWGGLDAVDGDLTDWRLEAGPVAVLLRTKGNLRGVAGAHDSFVKPTHA
jgi:hypothetical protein